MSSRKLISLTIAKDRTSIRVDDWPGKLSPYRVRTVNDADRPDITLLPEQLQRAINGRRRQGGQGKGRILYAEQDALGDAEPIVVGALVMHLEGSVPQIVDLGVADSKYGADREQLLNVMLSCAAAVASELKSPAILWLVHSEVAATSAARYGFRRLPNARNAPRGVIRMSRQL